MIVSAIPAMNAYGVALSQTWAPSFESPRPTSLKKRMKILATTALSSTDTAPITPEHAAKKYLAGRR